MQLERLSSVAGVCTLYAPFRARPGRRQPETIAVGQFHVHLFCISPSYDQVEEPLIDGLVRTIRSPKLAVPHCTEASDERHARQRPVSTIKLGPKAVVNIISPDLSEYPVRLSRRNGDDVWGGTQRHPWVHL